VSGTVAIFVLLGLGLVAGVLSGMFGIGGGLVIVPFLTIIIGLHHKTATGTSLFALLLPVGLLGVYEYYRSGLLRIDYGLYIALGLFIGAYFGARLTIQLSAASARRIYGVFLLVVGVYYVFLSKDPAHQVQPPAAQAAEEP
jgi:uncharacterized protein